MSPASAHACACPKLKNLSSHDSLSAIYNPSKLSGPTKILSCQSKSCPEGYFPSDTKLTLPPRLGSSTEGASPTSDLAISVS